ncbi:MAG: hypothetical protein KME52_04710 [Desmonostoc geniculatum HA4340-LM1]|jgi:hypothetical protein|nr:hypothetical protein [Desmonostoc geniculatum HA4340-LM1]
MIPISGIRISNFPNAGKQRLSLGAFSDISYISQTIPTVTGQHYQLIPFLFEDAPYKTDAKLHTVAAIHELPLRE